MRAIEIGERNGLDSWRLVEREVPEVGRGQVLVRIQAVSLNYRDVLLADRTYGFPVRDSRVIAASDGAGEIVAIGQDVTKWKIGDRVAGNFNQNWIGGAQPVDAFHHMLSGARDGMLAEVVVLNEDGVVAIPENLSSEEAATLPVAAVTAWNSLYGLKTLQPGQTVLTLGTGGVSIFVVQIAHAAGARVIVVSGEPRNFERVRALGASDVVNSSENSDWAGEVRRMTDGRGVDHVLETGFNSSLARSIASTRAGGVVNLLSFPRGDTLDATVLLNTSAILRGINVGSREMFEAISAFIAHKRIRPVIDRVFEFDDAKLALATLAKGGHFGKIVVRLP